MDLQDQLRHLFPNHQAEEKEETYSDQIDFWMQEEPIFCKYEKRKGKPITLLENYNGASSDFKKLTQRLQKKFHVGASAKDEKILLQTGDRDEVMNFLKSLGFNVKRVGG